MQIIELHLDGDAAWPDLASRRVIQAGDTWNLAALDQGMVSGEPSVALRFDLDDHVTLVAQTSLRQWIAATAAIRGRFPDAFVGTPMEGGHK
ncbi:MAG: hypothetical protein ACRD0W_06830 [Acidimicrobiales bacterium]